MILKLGLVTLAFVAAGTWTLVPVSNESPSPSPTPTPTPTAGIGTAIHLDLKPHKPKVSLGPAPRLPNTGK